MYYLYVGNWKDFELEVNSWYADSNYVDYTVYGMGWKQGEME